MFLRKRFAFYTFTTLTHSGQVGKIYDITCALLVLGWELDTCENQSKEKGGERCLVTHRSVERLHSIPSDVCSMYVVRCCSICYVHA